MSYHLDIRFFMINKSRQKFREKCQHASYQTTGIEGTTNANTAASKKNMLLGTVKGTTISG
jgi:hypothetical protein